MGSGFDILNKPIPDPGSGSGVKKAPDSRSRSPTLNLCSGSKHTGPGTEASGEGVSGP